MDETRLMNDVKMRDKCIEHIEVLGKIKQYLTVPGTELLTLNQVAEFYEVPFWTLQTCYKTHSQEVDMDGVVTVTPKSYKEIFNKQSSDNGEGENLNCLNPTIKKILNAQPLVIKNLEQLNGKLVVHVDDNTQIVIPNRGIKMFPKRAVLRIGMLLTQSEVAKQVRTQLLNIFEKTETANPELITSSITEEEALYVNLAKSIINNNTHDIFAALQDVVDYNNRYRLKIEKQLESATATNKILSTEILTISDREMASRVVRCMAQKTGKPYSALWNTIYTHLEYKYSISLKKRRKKSYESHISTLKPDEYGKLQKVIAVVAEEHGLNPANLFAECKTIK